MGDSTCVEKMIKINNFLTFISLSVLRYFLSFFFFKNTGKHWFPFRSHLFPPYLLQSEIQKRKCKERKLILWFFVCNKSRHTLQKEVNGNEMKWHPNIIFHNSFLCYFLKVHFICDRRENKRICDFVCLSDVSLF